MIAEDNNKKHWRRWPTIILATTTSIVASISLADDPLTLDAYYRAALFRSETVSIQSELIKQAEEHYQQASGALLPTVTGSATYTWQDPQPLPNPPPASPPAPDRQRLVKLTATQPLFRGFREFAGLRQTRSLLDAQSSDYRHAQMQLFQDTAENFYDVLSLEKDLANYDDQIVQNLKREAELRDRARIGRSRASEVLTIQSSISSLRAQVEQLRAQLHAAREMFAFLSGLDASTPLRDDETPPDDIGPLADYLTDLERRPDVKASQQRSTAAQENVSVARGAHLPSLDLTANRYFERNNSLENVEWDVQLALTVPLYAGGSTQSKIREALSQQTQMELTFNRQRRQAEQEIRSAYQNVQFDRSRLDALEKATDAAGKNYEAQLRDYRLSLVTNLDVLQAQTAFEENQRALDRARYAAKLNYLKLQIATARRPVFVEMNAP